MGIYSCYPCYILAGLESLSSMERKHLPAECPDYWHFLFVKILILLALGTTTLSCLPRVSTVAGQSVLVSESVKDQFNRLSGVPGIDR
jgi:hypothetical protein